MNTLKIIMATTVFWVLAFAAYVNWMGAKRHEQDQQELSACIDQWQTMNRMLEEGKIVIKMEKSDLTK